MPKAVISNKIYLEKPSDDQLKKIVKALTYSVVKETFQRMGSGKLNPKKQIEYIKNYSLLPGGIVTIPQGRVDLIPEEYTIVDKRVLSEVPFPTPSVPLRDSQLEVFNQVNDSCIINAKVGWGKTFTALHIARKLGQKTLVITHTTNLRDQWISEARALYNMPIGVIGSGKFDIEDHAIVVANIQSLKKHLPEVSREFGTVLLDECLDYETMLQTLEYGPVKIGALVNQKKQASVLSVNLETGCAEYKKVLQWFKTPETFCLKIKHSGGGSLKCTPNHNVYVLKDNVPVKKQAISLEPGDLLLQTTDRHKSTHILQKSWLPLILGIVLGDGSLGYAHSKSDSLRLRITHGVDQWEYLEWKAEILQAAGLVFGETKSGYVEKAVFNYTTASFYDTYGIYSALYNNGSKKTVPSWVAETLTKESWAIMFQDDGSSSKVADALVFSFCELDEKSISNLQHSLCMLFGISDSVQYACNKGYRYLRLNKEATQVFLKSIGHLVHPSMYYKLDRFLKTNLTNFEFQAPAEPVFVEGYATRKIISIESSTLTGNHKFNIEVEDNHNYFANGILVSNCHHVPATTFTEAVDSLYARYKIGLSGTLDRKDGKHVLLTDFFSSTVYKPPVDNTIAPIVNILRPGVFLESGKPWATKINSLLYDSDYQKFIGELVKTTTALGHSVLIIASRIEFLQKVQEYVGDSCVLLTGETENRELIKDQINSGAKTSIAGSRQIFAEGISINRLSAVILAEPMAYDGLIEQIIGRVMRQHPDKPLPEVFDVNFSDHASRSQNEKRLAFYMSKGWEVQRY